jgi:hypothetical protein
MSWNCWNSRLQDILVFWFKPTSAFEIYEIWGCALNKNYSFLSDKIHGYIIYMI